MDIAPPEPAKPAADDTSRLCRCIMRYAPPVALRNADFCGAPEPRSVAAP